MTKNGISENTGTISRESIESIKKSYIYLKVVKLGSNMTQ